MIFFPLAMIPKPFRFPLTLLAVGIASFTSGSRAQSYKVIPSVTTLPAGANGATISGVLQGDASTTLDVNLCFYTGYGSSAPIVPATFTYASSGATLTIAVPSSSIQDVPPSAFSNGSFAAMLYTVPLSTTSCQGPGQPNAGEAGSIVLEYPRLTSLSMNSAPQQNPNLNHRIPGAMELIGTNFIAQSSVVFVTPGAASTSIAGIATLINSDSIVSNIPASIPLSALSVEATVCNTAVYSYCTAPLPLQLIPLQVESGTVTPSLFTASSSQPIGFSATFAPATVSAAGAPSGLATFTDAATVIASSPLLLDTTAVFVPVPTTSFTTDSRPVQPIVVDLNHDGIPDLLFIEPNAAPNGARSSLIHVLLGTTPAGQFAPDKQYTGLKELPCVTLLSTAVADFTGDGYPDIALLCSNPNPSGPPSGVLYTLFNGGSGGLEGKVLSYGPLFGDRIAAADFNNDGKADIVVAGAVDSAGDTGLQVLLGNGDGTFHAGPVAIGLDTAPSGSFGGFHFAIADLNNDGFPDIAVLNGASASGSVDSLIQLFQNDGTGAFRLAATVPSDGTNSASFFLAPLGPGQMPALVISSIASAAPGISVARNQGTAGIAFSAPSGTTSVPGLTQAIVGDFNGDGLLDIAVTDASTTHVLTGDGTGVFAAAYALLSIVPPAGATLLAADDENGDGYADLLEAATSSSGEITIYDYITSGTASASTPSVAFAPGGHHIVATTPGTVEIAGTSASTDITINPATPVILLTASAGSPVAYGSQVTLYGTIADATATGKVSFYNGAVLLGTSPLISTGSGVAAAFTPPLLSAGTYSFTAVYSGDAAHTTATSATFPFVVGAVAPTLSWTPTPAAMPYGVPLSNSQLDASATGIGGVAVSGTFAYVPALGTILKAGTHLLAVTFTPSSTNYLTATASASVTVTQAGVTLTWTPNPNSIVYGTALSAAQLDASAAAFDTASVPGTYTYTPALGSVLATGTHTLSVAFAPTDTLDFSAATAIAAVKVTQATPVITWPTPADIIVDSALTSTQLDATAATPGGAALSGTFAYTPALGTILSVAGTDQLSVLFTPTDTANYTTATATVAINVGPLGLSSIVPSAALLGDASTTIAITGTGFSPTSVVTAIAPSTPQTVIPTTYVSSTSLTAVLPATYFQTVQKVQLFVYDPSKNLPSNTLPFIVTAPSTSLGVSAPTTISPASQTTIIFHLSPYPAPVDAMLTLEFKPLGALPDDPGIVFVVSGIRTSSVIVPAHAAELDLPVTFQSGTVAGTLTVTLVLEAGGANITPASIQPIVIQEPVAPAGISSVSMQQNGDLLTVTTRGYSNSRKVTGASFRFTPVPGGTISTPAITIDPTSLFSTWYADPESDQYGSLFTYSEVFNLSSDASVVGQVTVTLTNDVGTSQEANTP